MCTLGPSKVQDYFAVESCKWILKVRLYVYFMNLLDSL